MHFTNLLAAINAQQGTLLILGEAFSGGEQGAYSITDEHGAQYALKHTPGDDALARFQAACEITARLRAQGYPASRYRYVGMVDHIAYNVQEVLPGRPMGRLDVALLPRLLELNALQAQAAPSPNIDWPGEIVRSILDGCEGYCVIESLRTYSAETMHLLAALQAIAVGADDLRCPRGDTVHYDFNPNNILVHDGRVGGVIDWDGARSGDCAFDLATLLFYTHAADLQTALWEAAGAHTSLAAIRLYLAHMIVRQVAWSIRNHTAEVAQYWLAHSLTVERHYLAVT